MAELIPVYQTLYGAKPPTEIQQVKYAPAPVPVSGPMYQTLYGAPPVGEIQQVKYAPAPVQPTIATLPQQVKYAPAPISGPIYQTLYGAPPISEIQQVKYAPAPIQPTVAVTFPEQVKYAPAPVQPTIAVTFPEQVKYAPAPVQPTIAVTFPEQVKYAPAPVQPTVVVTMPPVTQEEAETVVSSISTNNESIVAARSFKDEIETISQNADTVINNTSYVTGEFGKALTYASQVVKEDIDALNKYSQNNLLVAMNKVGEYEDNIAAMRAILRPIVGEYSTDRFDESGHLIVSDAIRSNYSKEIAITEELFRNNKTLKDEISSLSNSSISKS